MLLVATQLKALHPDLLGRRKKKPPGRNLRGALRRCGGYDDVEGGGEGAAPAVGSSSAGMVAGMDLGASGGGAGAGGGLVSATDVKTNVLVNVRVPCFFRPMGLTRAERRSFRTRAVHVSPN